MPKKSITLKLAHLKQGTPALGKATGTVHAECASVCLEHAGHGTTVALHVHRSRTEYVLERMPVTRKMRSSHIDLPRTTETGACGVAILLVTATQNLVAWPAYRGGGFDYWLRSPRQPKNSLPFQKAKRLEVSGILSGTDSEFSNRVNQKLAQSKPSDHTKTAALAVVVEFGRPQAEVAKR